MYKGNTPSDYTECFSKLKLFIDQSLDEVKSELVRVLFPIFVCLFLNMVKKKFMAEALDFMSANKAEFLPHHRNDIATLETVHDLQRLEDPEVAKYLMNKFFVKMSRHSYTLLKYQVDFCELNLIMHIMNLNISFQISSEPDIVIDSKCHESILLANDGFPKEGGGAEGQSASHQASESLNLGRLKEFYLEWWDTATSGAGQGASQQDGEQAGKNAGD